MALINGALQIGRSAITASQAALAVTGNNMANAATESYSRQTVHMAPTQYTEVIPGKYTGTGVALYEIRRQVDEALNGRLRSAVSDSASYLVQQQAMDRVEAAFNELTEEDLSSRLNAFFGAWSNLQNQPQDIAKRNVVIQEGNSLCNFVQELRTELSGIQDDLDSQVRFQVEQANSLADQIAELNEQVVSAEAGRAGSAAALRDQRDDLLKQLSELIDITTREVEGGSVNVFIGNDPLIQYSENRGLSYEEREDANGNMLAQVIFTDNQQPVDMSSGKIQGLIAARDDKVGSVISQLDSWSKSLILEVNQLHSLGRSLDGFSSVTAANDVEDLDASLADISLTDLPWQVSNGVFYINVIDGDGKTTTHQIAVSIGMGASDTTLNTLATDINNIDNLTATIDGANRLQITADSGYTFAFSAPADSGNATNVLAVLGINTFFDGSNAYDISVKSDLAASPRMMAASANGLAGNGDVAGNIAQLATSGVTSLAGMSLPDSFSTLVGRIATDAKAAQDNYTVADVIVQTLENERQSISGVSIDEEAIKMITFQRAFQGAARYVSIIDQMLDEIINLVD